MLASSGSAPPIQRNANQQLRLNAAGREKKKQQKKNGDETHDESGTEERGSSPTLQAPAAETAVAEHSPAATTDRRGRQASCGAGGLI